MPIICALIPMLFSYPPLRQANSLPCVLFLSAAAAAAAEDEAKNPQTVNALAVLPNQIESPAKALALPPGSGRADSLRAAAPVVEGESRSRTPIADFSDLVRPDQGTAAVESAVTSTSATPPRAAAAVRSSASIGPPSSAAAAPSARPPTPPQGGGKGGDALGSQPGPAHKVTSREGSRSLSRAGSFNKVAPEPMAVLEANKGVIF